MKIFPNIIPKSKTILTIIAKTSCNLNSCLKLNLDCKKPTIVPVKKTSTDKTNSAAKNNVSTIFSLICSYINKSHRPLQTN